MRHTLIRETLKFLDSIEFVRDKCPSCLKSRSYGLMAATSDDKGAPKGSASAWSHASLCELVLLRQRLRDELQKAAP